MKPWEAAVIILLLVGAAGYLGYITIPGVTPNSGVQPNQVTTNSVNTNLNADCQFAPIESELTSSNAQSVTSPTVATYQQLSPGTYTKMPSASGTLTQNTLNAASAYTSFPVEQVYNGTAVYPTTVMLQNGEANVIDPATGEVMFQVSCGASTASGSNTINILQAIATVFTGPASGVTAVTNVENVINSPTSQTNSFQAAFPTAAPVTVTDYLQIFSSNTIAGRLVTLPASTNAPITNYGGMNGQAPTSTVVKGGLVYYGPFAIVAFNQTGIAFTGPAGTVGLTLHGATGSVAFAIPLAGLCAGPSPFSGVATTNPYIGCQFNFQVQETVSATGHHVDMAVIIADNTQLGYIEQYFNAPVVTSYHAAGDTFGITGFTGIEPPTISSAPHPIIEQQSYVIATY